MRIDWVGVPTQDDGMDTWEPDLAAIIRKISDELLESQDQRIREGRPAVFRVGSLDVELNFVVTRSRTGSGGIDLRVVTLGGELASETQHVQKVTVHLDAGGTASPLAVAPREDASAAPGTYPLDLIAVQPRRVPTEAVRPAGAAVSPDGPSGA